MTHQENWITMNPLPSHSCQHDGTPIGPPPPYDMLYHHGAVSSQYVLTDYPSPSHFKPIFTTEQYVINTEISSVHVVTAPSNVIVAPPIYKDYMALSILSMLFCFLPVGIAALVYSCKTIASRSNGDHTTEARNSHVAFKLNVVAIFFGCALHAAWIVVAICT
ncbi:synapse differentiation-inducing gene protein 1-like isoform X1 [Rana temporaria]|uniref:synapse differentiation-inducing gene protein 1-like isoform X1 n=1 Tax=Rana temporaria TaxID=8407 RepID=UPI001AAD388C|nr:synapse differentiation-inducing gene protein 1-like isoform X1 [Rana temporaria]